MVYEDEVFDLELESEREMGSVSDEVDRFFDTREDITSVSDSSSDCPDDIDSLPGGIGYESWIDGPMSIQERRSRFLRWMGLIEGNMVSFDDVEAENCDRITESSGAVLGSSSSDESRQLSDETVESFSCRIRNLDDGTEFVVDGSDNDGVLRRLRKLDSGDFLSIEEFERSLGMSPLVQRLMQKGGDESFNSDVARKHAKRRWLKRISAAACIVDRQLASSSMSCDGSSYPYFPARARAVKVRQYKKRSKELSSLYTRQDIQAHDGSILTMKFSPDGQYLASAGEDGIVRVWQVVETERLDEFNIRDSDPSCSYFQINSFSEVVPLNADGEKKGKFKASGKLLVIFPRTVFHILEEPIHEFRGHCGEVLDLSWSKNKHLLSSSVDNTVRLWQVGCDRCLKVFSHNSYVTSIQFNPLDDNYFISGSIDGKVRIWEISACQVTDWTDITEIVTAVCYRPDGKEGVVGSMNGDCRFYDLSDNRLQLYAETSLQGKKKSPLNRITGFQFSPTDQSKLMVTSADSRVRILHGINLVCKYRGLRNTGSQISASFMNDGTHIVSASEDSNVYVWNYKGEAGPAARPKSHWSCEHFFSNKCSVAIPWRSKSLESCSSDEAKQSRPLSANHLLLSHGFFSELALRGSATWPEEKLPSSATSSTKCRSQHKFLKSFCQSSGVGFPQASWGLVIVTAGWDGRIRTFQNYGLPI